MTIKKFIGEAWEFVSSFVLKSNDTLLCKRITLYIGVFVCTSGPVRRGKMYFPTVRKFMSTVQWTERCACFLDKGVPLVSMSFLNLFGVFTCVLFSPGSLSLYLSFHTHRTSITYISARVQWRRRCLNFLSTSSEEKKKLSDPLFNTFRIFQRYIFPRNIEFQLILCVLSYRTNPRMFFSPFKIQRYSVSNCTPREFCIIILRIFHWR